MKTFPTKIIVENYQVLLIDLWGTLFHGVAIASRTLQWLADCHLSGLKIIYLSNCAWPTHMLLGKNPFLQALVPFGTGFMTSGDVAKKMLNDKQFHGNIYYFDDDEDLFNDNYDGLCTTQNLSDADIILLGNISNLNQCQALIESHMHSFLARNTCLLCVNPDRYIISAQGEKQIMPGLVADLYEECGGHVERLGKPHRRIYEAVLKSFDIRQDTKVLAIGDNYVTDIVGALNMNYDTMWVLSGTTTLMDESELILKKNTTTYYIDSV